MLDENANQSWHKQVVLALQKRAVAMRHSIGKVPRSFPTKVAAALVAGAVSAATQVYLAADNKNEEQHWTGTWSAGEAGISGARQYANQTLRLIVHTSIGGRQVRVRISNTFGTESLVIGAAHVALRKSGARICPDTDRALSFSGKSSFTIPAGALALSDPVSLWVPPLSDLAVSIYLPVLSTAATTHIITLQTNYVAQAAGDLTGAPDLPEAGTPDGWDFLTGVDVRGDSPGAAIVIVGDSITDGLGSTSDTNRRWPNFLSERLESRHGLKQVAVLNEGMGGNRLLHAAPPGIEFFGPAMLARFDRDVLGQAGLKYLVVLLGINDIAQAGIVAPDSEEVSADDIIAGHLQLIERAHERGIVVYGCTLLPFGNSLIAPGFYSPEKELKRETVNEWIRMSGAYDAVIDFDKVVRDPEHPLQVLPAYDSGDHTHLNDAGYRAMAQAIDLDLFHPDRD